MDKEQIFIKSLEESQLYIEKSTGFLNQEEMTWAPKPDCGSIIFIFWHLARVEDFWINRALQNIEEIYDSEGWQKLLGTPEKESGVGYDEAKLNSWPAPDNQTLKDYAAAVRQRTLDYLDSVQEEDYSREIRLGSYVMSVRDCLSHLITEIALHAGQIDYIRGMIRGLKA